MTASQKKSNTLQAIESDEPKKPLAKRVRYDSNPFLEGVVSTFGDKRVRVAMKPNLAEIDNVTGEVTRIPGEIVKIVSADKASFVKLYSAQLDAFFELSGSAKPVVKYLIFKHQQEPNKHLVVLHRHFAAQEGFDIPESTWFAGMKQLIEKSFLAASTASNSYYLNPAIFFNGDRTRFVVEIKRQHGKQKTLSVPSSQLSLDDMDSNAF